MNKREKLTIILLVAYLAVAILTFGRAYNNAPLARGIASQAEVSVVSAMPAALFWPFYWSTVLWEK